MDTKLTNDFLSSPNSWKNKGGQQDDYEYIVHVKLQEFVHMG